LCIPAVIALLDLTCVIDAWQLYFMLVYLSARDSMGIRNYCQRICVDL